MADQNPDAALEQRVQQLIASGASRDEIAHVVQAYDDMQHPIRAAVGGAFEGIVPGLLSAVTAPFHAAVGTLQDTLSVLQGGSPDNAKALIEFPAEFKKAWDEGGPRERARLISEAVTSLGTGYAMTTPPALRTVGRGVEHLGENSFASRLASGALLYDSVRRGNFGEAGAGVGLEMMRPKIAEFGRRLRIVGGEDPATVIMGPEGVAKNRAKGFRILGKMDEQEQTARREAAKLADLKSQKAGTTPKQSPVRETTATTDPETGRRLSSTTTYKPAEEEEDPLAAAGIDPSRIISVRPGAQAGAVNAKTGGIQPGIRIMGKAAQDLAEGRVPSASAAPTPTPRRMDELQSQFAASPSQSKIQSILPHLSENDVHELSDIMRSMPGATTDDIVNEVLKRRANRSADYRDIARMRPPEEN